LVLASLERGPERRAVSTYLTESWRIAPELTGKDLRRLGFPPGPLYREFLGALRSAKLDGRLRTREDEISFVYLRFGRRTLQD
jgi:tRNA nucleotidyltransferase (CCA-adding enzyme)